MNIESYSQMFNGLKKENEGAFIPFVVAGDPDFETSLDIVRTFVDSGADALEIGFAFSDPVADGPICRYKSSQFRDHHRTSI